MDGRLAVRIAVLVRQRLTDLTELHKFLSNIAASKGARTGS